LVLRAAPDQLKKQAGLIKVLMGEWGRGRREGELEKEIAS
jgi:hypothetical protein